MPFAIRRTTDGWWLKKTTSNREFIADPAKATMWGRCNDAVSACRHLPSRLASENSEIQVVELETRVVRIAKTMTLVVDGEKPWKTGYQTVESTREGFRHVDD